jgi:hypothetical protein
MSGWRDIRSGVAGQRDALIESLGKPQRQQEQLLQRILERNAETEFGRRCGFGKIDSLADYQRHVPLQHYRDVLPDVEKMMAGEMNILVRDKVLLFEQTGGSTGGSKFLPFTESGIADMRKALLPWLDDLIAERPGITQGSAYWSISPAARKRTYTSAGIPVGIDNDALYFGEHLARAIDATLAVPASVAAAESIDAWRFQTLCYLLASKNLSLVSVWSPTFFLQLLDGIAEQIERVAICIESGGAGTGLRLHADATRAKELRSIFAHGTPRWDAIWPHLDTISCWSSATSRPYADELKQRLPAIHLAGKGLLATEGIVTVPLCGASSPVLAVDSGVYEFMTEDGQTLAPWDVATGMTYSVVITTAAGLYRYRLGDRVTVTGWFKSTPCLEYVGREGGGSDLCGEKLTEEFVGKALSNIPGFHMLVPVSEPRPSYLLLLDAGSVAADSEQKTVELADSELMANPQYRYARELGQLPPPAPCRVADALGTYNNICLQSGQRLGNIKISALASAAWSAEFVKSSKD